MLTPMLHFARASVLAGIDRAAALLNGRAINADEAAEFSGAAAHAGGVNCAPSCL